MRAALIFLLLFACSGARVSAATADQQEELMRSLLETFIGAGDLPSALETARKAGKLYPKSVFWVKKSGELSLWSGDPKSALASFKRLLSLENTRELRARVAVLAIGIKDYETALYALELDLAANNLEKADDLIYIYEQLGRPEEAADLIEKYSDRFNSPSGYAKAIELHTNMGDKQAAEINYRTSIRKFGLTPVTAHGYAELLSSKRDLAAAFEILKSAEPRAKRSDTSFWKMLGDLAWYFGDVQRAVKAAAILDGEGAAQEPEYDRLTSYYRAAGMEIEAEKFYIRAWQNTSKPYFLMSWLNALARRGDYAAVGAAIAGLNPEQARLAATNQYFWTLKAIAEAETGNMAGALAAYDAALSISPDSEEVKIQLIWFLSSGHRGPQLRERIGPLSAGGAELPEKQLALSYAYMAAGDSGSALERIAAYRRLNPSGDAPEFRADALEAGGFTHAAQEVSFGRWLKLAAARNAGSFASAQEAADWLRLCARFCSAPRFSGELNLLSTVLDREKITNALIGRASLHGEQETIFRLGRGLKEYPVWLKLSKALTYTETGELDQLLAESRDALPFRDRITALERLGFTSEARAQTARLYWKNGGDIFLNLKAAELLDKARPSVTPASVYRKRKALETSGAAVSARAAAGERLTFTAGGAVFRRSAAKGGALIIARKEDKDGWAGVSYDGKHWDAALKAGGRDAAKKFFTAGFQAARTLTGGMLAELEAGCGARADESSYLEAAGMRDHLSAGVSGPLAKPYYFRVSMDAAQYFSQERIYAGRMSSGRAEISRQDRVPGWAVSTRLYYQNASADSAPRAKGTLDAASPFDGAVFVPSSFNQYGTGFTLTRDGYKLPLRRLSPYLSADYYYNSSFLGGFGSRAGATFSPWRRDIADFWVEYSKGYQGAGDEIKGTGASLTLYF
ncbi:MAG TPA: hypothetical protein DCS63_00990 [Elusimicrobia bacterium]|nr:hypothetical protein [Elusimicrobiota bacterium]